MAEQTPKRPKRGTTTPSSADGTHYARVNVNDAIYERIQSFAKRFRTRHLTLADKASILLMHGYLRHQAFLDSKKSGRKKKMNFNLAVAKASCRKLDVVRRVWQDFLQDRDFNVTPDNGPRGKKHARIKSTTALRMLLRDWLHERNLRRTRTVAKYVVAFLVDNSKLPADNTETEAKSKATLRTVRRFINSELGWVRGERKGSKTYIEKEHIILQRNAYVRKMTEAVNTRRVVYMDESYINQHHNCLSGNLYDPEEDRLLPKLIQKERRFCFIAAIISEDPTVQCRSTAGADVSTYLRVGARRRITTACSSLSTS